MSTTIILYDLPSKGHCACWSYHPWKARLVLKYKNLAYATEWVEYPDIAGLEKSFGIPPNTEGRPYTMPAIKSSTGKYMQDSKAIAQHLDSLQPSPPLHLDASALSQVEQTLGKCISALRPVTVPCVARNLLNPKSAEYFESTRAQMFGMSLTELEKSDKGGENAWKAAREPLQQLAGLLKEKEEGGPFFLGKEPSYADFVVVGFLQFCKRARQDIFDRVVGTDPAFSRLYDACGAWLEKDDH